MMTAERLKDFIAKSQGLTVLYVEDDEQLQEDTVRLLSKFFHSIHTAANGREGLRLYEGSDTSHTYDMVITDIRMPVMNGIEMIAHIRKTNRDQKIIVTSAHDESSYLMELIGLGVNNFVLKPIDVKKFLSVLEETANHIWLLKREQEYKKMLEDTVHQKTMELFESHKEIRNLTDEILLRLVSAAEYKDTDTGAHIVRIGLYAKKLAETLGMSREFVESIAFAGPLHDVGKIGIPDNILLKPGPLTGEEFEVMKSHTIIGSRILSRSGYEKIRMAEAIALYHHERWDGSGYPMGLKGEEIPIEARIVIICDQYDALMMPRPYKPSFGHERTLEILTKGDGRTLPDHFDPKVLNGFMKTCEELERIFHDNQ